MSFAATAAGVALMVVPVVMFIAYHLFGPWSLLLGPLVLCAAAVGIGKALGVSIGPGSLLLYFKVPSAGVPSGDRRRYPKSSTCETGSSATTM